MQKDVVMKRVYICAPYTGDIEANKKRAKRFARLAVELGYIPFVPHLHYENFMSETLERDHIMAFCIEEVKRSDEVWQCSEHKSPGMMTELGIVKGHGIKTVKMWVVEK
jgi:nucleoside 2-deoxyribosyltransferase